MLSRVPVKQRKRVAREVESAVQANRGTEVSCPSTAIRLVPVRGNQNASSWLPLIFLRGSLAIPKVDLSSVFRSRLESTVLYPSPGVFRMEKHHGPVHSIDCSPFHRQAAPPSNVDSCLFVWPFKRERSRDRCTSISC